MWDVSEPYSEVDIAVFAEGTYPFARGGVSSVMHSVIKGSPELSFGVIHLCWDGETPKNNQFEELPNLRWVKKVFLSPDWNKKFGRKWDRKWSRSATGVPPTIKLSRKSTKQLAAILSDLKEGRYDKLETFYRRHPGWFRDSATKSSPILSHIPFLKLLIKEYFGEGMSYLDSLWLTHEFTGLLNQLFAQQYPKAKVYHSHTNGYAGLAAVLAKWQNGGKFLLSEHALYVRDAISFIPRAKELKESGYAGGEHFPLPIAEVRSDKWEGWFRGLGRFVYQQIDASAYLYQQAFEEAKAYGYPAETQTPAIIPNGVDMDHYRQAREAQVARNQLRRKKDHCWTIGFIGRVVPIKGVLEYFDAIKHLTERKGRKVEFRVMIVGPTDEDPSYYQRCLARLRQLKLEDRVFFTGMQKVEEVMGHLDIIALPSLSEAFPMVCLEAMASGVPMVAHDVGCIRDIVHVPATTTDLSDPVTIRQAGAVVAKGEPKAFADKLYQLMTTAKSYASYQKQGPLIVAENFQTAEFLQRYHRLYDQLLGKPVQQALPESRPLAAYEYLQPGTVQAKP